MRPYLVLCAVLLMALAGAAQQPVPGAAPYYGWGPFVPLVTTPMISLTTISPNPVGASNATTGLVAGATNSTLSQIDGPTSSDYTAAVWYQGGAPLTESDVSLWPKPAGHGGHPPHHMAPEPPGPHAHAPHKEAHEGWMYYTGSEHTANVVTAAAAAKGERKAGHVYTNDDVTRQNDNNGNVKYDGKTEKM